MIQSMTAFSRIESQQDACSLACEMRSINHRYLEISLHLPDALRAFEMPMRESIRQFVKRGKIECAIRYQPTAAAADASFTVNTVLAKELCFAAESIAQFAKEAMPLSVTDILRFPGVLTTKEVDRSQLQKTVLNLLETTLRDLIAAREREGKELTQLFVNRLELMQHELVKVKQRLPEVMKDARERLLKRFTDAKLELDPNRLEQEMVMFANKVDVAEEIERTETHITEVRRILQAGGTVGRRLDFLLQELNREANTLGSKSTDPVLTHAAVELKVLIEQVREQVQNVE